MFKNGDDFTVPRMTEKGYYKPFLPVYNTLVFRVVFEVIKIIILYRDKIYSTLFFKQCDSEFVIVNGINFEKHEI